MNYLDLIIISIIGIFVIRGVQKGLLMTLTGVVSFLAALFIATGLVGSFAQRLQDTAAISKVSAYIFSYIVLFFGILLILRIVAHITLKIFEVTSTRWIDRVGGCIFGFLIGSLLLSVVFIVLSFFSFTERLLPERENSMLYTYTRNFFPSTYNVLKVIRPATHSFQDITAELLQEQPRELLEKTEAGRDFLKYLKKFQKEAKKELRK